MHTGPYVSAAMCGCFGLGMGVGSAYAFLNGTAGIAELVAAVFAPAAITWAVSSCIKCKLSAVINDRENTGITNNMDAIKDITNCDRNNDDCD